ncbi:MORN motif, variant 2 [Balamuthia mandrillaris]
MAALPAMLGIGASRHSQRSAVIPPTSTAGTSLPTNHHNEYTIDATNAAAASHGLPPHLSPPLSGSGSREGSRRSRHHHHHHHHNSNNSASSPQSGQPLSSSAGAAASSSSSLPNGGAVYQGERNAAGQPHGQGTMTWANGKKYSGSFREGVPHGRGVMHWPNGERFEGECKNGKAHGFAIRIYQNGTKYEGYWVEDQEEGKGTMTWADGRVYSGDWKAGKRCGYGVMTWPDGRRYEGECKDNMCHGFGEFVYSNGDVYKGEWKEDNRHGLGSYTVTKRGIWELDKPIGKHSKHFVVPSSSSAASLPSTSTTVAAVKEKEKEKETRTTSTEKKRGSHKHLKRSSEIACKHGDCTFLFYHSHFPSPPCFPDKILFFLLLTFLLSFLCFSLFLLQQNNSCRPRKKDRTAIRRSEASVLPLSPRNGGPARNPQAELRSRLPDAPLRRQRGGQAGQREERVHRVHEREHRHAVPALRPPHTLSRLCGVHREPTSKGQGALSFLSDGHRQHC